MSEIINSMVNKRNELFTRINKPTSKMTRQEVKAKYNQIAKEKFETTNNCFEKLSNLAKSNAKNNKHSRNRNCSYYKKN